MMLSFTMCIVDDSSIEVVCFSIRLIQTGKLCVVIVINIELGEKPVLLCKDDKTYNKLIK